MNISASKPKTVVSSSSSFWSSKEAIESNTTQGLFYELKESQEDLVEVGASFFNEAPMARLKRKGKKLIKYLPAMFAGAGALGVGAAALGVVSAPLALGLSVGVAGAAGLSWLSGQMLTKPPKEDVPNGLSIQHTSEESVAYDLTEESAPWEGLREVVATNMKLFPTSTHVVHFNGHGHGAKSVGGLPGDKVDQALEEAVAAGGKPIDIGFYETCFGANYEMLSTHADSVKYAVAFEDQIPKSNHKLGRLPLDKLFGLGSLSSQAGDFAHSLAAQSAKHFESTDPVNIGTVPFKERNSRENRTALWENTDSTVAAFDLQELATKLTPSLNETGQQLSKLMERSPHYKNTIRDVKSENELEGTGDLIDMGGFLGGLSERLPVEETPVKASIRHTLEALDDTMMFKRTGEDLPLSGLSFHAKPEALDFSRPVSNPHQNDELPQQWVQFVQKAFD